MLETWIFVSSAFINDHIMGFSNQVLPTQSAVSVLWELSPGGALMQAHTQQQLHRKYKYDGVKVIDVSCCFNK